MLQAYQKPLKGTKVGIVFGSFAPLHQGHMDIIMQAKKENDAGCIVVVCGFDGDKGEPIGLPMSRRYRYVRETFAKDDLVAVCAVNDTEVGIPMYPDGWEPWLNEFNTHLFPSLVENTSEIKQVWYVGDKEYYEGLTERGYETVLADRYGPNPICATMIRQNPVKYWDKIMHPFKRVFSTNILITGTASEGKTTLTQDLGKYFNAPCSEEWARQYMDDNCLTDWELTSADFLAFIEGQYNLNKSLINSSANHGVFFADTDPMVTKMYAEAYSQENNFAITPEEFKKVAIVCDELTSKSKWDKIFLLAPKGEFVDDHVRYMGHSELQERQNLFRLLCNYLIESNNWDKVTILNGGYYDNFITIVNYVKGIIEHGKD